MIQLTLCILSLIGNFILIFIYGKEKIIQSIRQRDESFSFADHAMKQAEVITKAVELNNAYCNAVSTVIERTGTTEWEDELFKDVNTRQKTFLYHLRKLNPDYTIIKNH